MNQQEQRLWTVFFIAKAVDGYIDELIKMINKIRATNISPQFAVVFCIKISKDNERAVRSGDLSLLSTRPIQRQVTQFYEIIRPEVRSGRFYTDLNFLSELEHFDETNPDHVNYFFREWVLKNVAKNYFLITWDHGTSYGMFDEFQRKFLTMEGLAYAINSAFGKRCVDLIMMCNCDVHSMDTLYAFRERALHLVAPTRAFDMSGYNYSAIFDFLIRKPEVSSRELSKFIVDSFGAIGIPKHEHLYATDIRYLPLLTSLIDLLAEYLQNLLPEKRETILKARDESLYTGDLIHIFRFIGALVKNRVFEAGCKIPRLAEEIWDSVIIADYPKNVQHDEAFAITIFFPTMWTLNDGLNLDFEQRFKTDFAIMSSWMKFVKKMIDSEKIPVV